MPRKLDSRRGKAEDFHGQEKNEIILTCPCATRLRSARLKTADTFCCFYTPWLTCNPRSVSGKDQINESFRQIDQCDKMCIRFAMEQMASSNTIRIFSPIYWRRSSLHHCLPFICTSPQAPIMDDWASNNRNFSTVMPAWRFWQWFQRFHLLILGTFDAGFPIFTINAKLEGSANSKDAKSLLANQIVLPFWNQFSFTIVFAKPGVTPVFLISRFEALTACSQSQKPY